MTEKTKHTSNNLEEIRGKFKTFLNEIKSLDKDALKDLGDEYYTDIKHILHVEDVKHSLNHSFNQLEDKIKATPLRSVALCVGIGFLLAKLFEISKKD